MANIFLRAYLLQKIKYQFYNNNFMNNTITKMGTSLNYIQYNI